MPGDHSGSIMKKDGRTGPTSKFIFVPPLVLVACNRWTSSSSNRSLLRSVTIMRESLEISRDR